MAGEIFISYRRADQAKAGLLYQLLKDRGVDAWYDALLDAGDDWRNKTANALVAAPIFVLLFSKAAAQSDDISKELAAATFQKKTVIPVRIDNIHPEGAFLYELASRNWFDAYEDTEARLAVLADRLAAVVKGGADARAAALKLGAPIDVIAAVNVTASAAAPVAPAAPPAAKPLLKRPVILAAIAAVAVALIGGAAFLMQPKTAAVAPSQRVAFFGFTATDEDPASRNIAAIATDEAFTNLGLRRIETVARGDAVIPAGATRLDRASQIGARYALSGDLRRDGDLARFAMRFEDVTTRSTLWEMNLERPISETTPTAFAAADAAVRLANCFSYSAFTDVTGRA